MKVGVLTLPLHTNFGGNLQAYALITFLKEIGHDAWMIRWEKDRIPLWKAPLTITKRLLLKFILGRPGVDIGSGIFDVHRRAILEVHAKRFIEHHIYPQTSGFRSTRSLARDIGNYNFDAIIVGSDQIWRPKPNIEDFFLGFLDHTCSKIKRVAYAASFGEDQWLLGPLQHQICSNLLKKFDAVSVREDTGVSLCQHHFGVQAEHVIDPTMLLSSSHYADLVGGKYSTPHHGGGKGLFVYVLDMDSDKEIAIEKISTYLKMKRFSAGALANVKPTQYDKTVVPPVEDWLRGFIEADFVLTDSFHGCAFSILFNKPFIAYGNKSRGLSRFKSILKMFCLSDRLIDSSITLSPGSQFYPIDWPAVNTILEKHRMESTNFLTKSLTS